MRFRCALFAISICWLLGCGEAPVRDAVVVGIKADADQINSVTHFSAFGRILCTGVFPRLLESHIDSATGVLSYSPLLAKSYERSPDKKSLTYHLRTDFRWEDGYPVTATDILFTFSLIANPAVASSKKEHIALFDVGEPADINNAIVVENDSTVTFRFVKAYPLQVYDTNLQPGFLPQHVLQNVRPENLKSHEFNLKPLSAGPYRVDYWRRQEEIAYVENPSYPPGRPGIAKIFFRVIPEYVTRLSALKNGEIDAMYPVNPQDALTLEKNHPDIRLEMMRGRYYDYIGWQNIDGAEYRKSGGKIIRPHPLFGSRNVRTALTMAINREEIIRGFLGPFGAPAFGPVSPAFKWAYNDTLKPYPYDPVAARALLASAGWSDHDGDGILDKAGRPFAFDLYYDAGNDRREFAALLIQKDLAAVGIKATINSAETNVFYEKELNKEYDAFISGIGVTLMIDPTSEWNSDLLRNRYNDISYQNAEVDALIEKGKSVEKPSDAADIWKRFQAVIHEDQPVTFLYWRDEIIAYRQSIKNTSTSLLGEIDKYWMWKRSTD